MPIIPANPAVTRGAFQGRRREAQSRNPFLFVDGDVPERVADLRQVAKVVVLLHQFPIARLFAGPDPTNHYLLQIDPHPTFLRGSLRFVQLERSFA